MLGLLIISIPNGLFKAGHVKVRGLEINHADSSFPPVELAGYAGVRWIIVAISLLLHMMCGLNQQ